MQCPCLWWLEARLAGDNHPQHRGARAATHLRKLQARHGDRQCSTQVGMLKMEQRLGSSAVGPPPLIMITLWTRSGYSWARKVQKDTLQGEADVGATLQPQRMLHPKADSKDPWLEPRLQPFV